MTKITITYNGIYSVNGKRLEVKVGDRVEVDGNMVYLNGEPV